MRRAPAKQAGVVSPKYVTVRGACEFSGLGRTTVKTLIQTQTVRSVLAMPPGAKRGRRLIDLASLEAWLDGFAAE